MSYYRTAAARGQTVYEIDPRRSQVVIRVHRAGPLSAFGHEHVVESHDVRGYVLFGEKPAERRADLYLQLTSLQVDAPQLRKAAGLDEGPSPPDVRATRDHMLNSVLKAQHYPYAVVHLESLTGSDGQTSLRATIQLHDRLHRYTVPVRIEQTGNTLRASGKFRIRQSDFGIEPYTVFGGALRVADPLDLTFDIVGRLFRSKKTASN